MKKRRLINCGMKGLSLLCALSALVPLFLILSHLVSEGISSIDISFFTELPKPVGEEGGGLANALVGSLVLVGIACLIGLPIGILGGIYLSEFGKNKLGDVIRFSADMLNGTPSIVIGIFVYALIVIPMGGFSAIAGGVALGILMIPTLLRTTETMMDLVPSALREGGLALGIPYWKTLLSIILKTAKSGIVTGILLSIARIAGETAPLLFTSLGNQFWSTRLTEPIAAIPLQIFNFAISPFEEWHQQAWAAALVLMGVIFLLNVVARIFVRSPWQKGRG